jgi:thioredoxin-related protein
MLDKKTSALFSALGVVLLLAPCLLASDKPFESHRDPEKDLLDAEKQATAEHKNIFLDFGGNWCPPCLELDRALHEDKDLEARLQRSFVVVHIDVGGIFPNKAATKVRKQFPQFKRYPHVVIVSPEGKVVHDEVSGDFMTNADGRGYSHEVLGKFLDKWAPDTQ